MSTDSATKPATREPEERGVLVNDPEIKALAQCDRVLGGLPPEAAVRVADYLRQKYMDLRNAAFAAAVTSPEGFR